MKINEDTGILESRRFFYVPVSYHPLNFKNNKQAGYKPSLVYRRLYKKKKGWDNNERDDYIS